MNPTENPPAFPSGLENGGTSRVQGMSLRDWFAGQALSGLIVTTVSGVKFVDLASDAYNIADAMLTERNKPV